MASGRATSNTKRYSNRIQSNFETDFVISTLKTMYAAYTHTDAQLTSTMNNFAFLNDLPTHLFAAS